MNRLTSIWQLHQSKLVTLTDQGIVSGINFLMGILLARWIGLENYGVFAIVWMVVLFVSSIHQSAFVSSLFALLPKQENKDLFISKLMGLQLGFSLLVIIAIAALGVSFGNLFHDFSGISYTTILLTAGISGVFVLNDFVRRVGFAKQLSPVVLGMDLIGYSLQPILLFVWFQFGSLDVNATLSVLLITYSVSAIFGVFRLRCFPTLSKLKITALDVWSYSRFLVGTSLLQWLSGNFYLITAAGILGPVALGAIRIAQNVMGVMHVLLISLENLVPIKAAETLNENGAYAAVKYVFQMFLQAGIPFIGLLIPIALFRAELLELIYGNSYADYAFVLLAFCAIYILIFIGTQLRFLIRTFERNNLIFWSYVATSILGLTTANLFVNHFQIYGVLLGIALTQIIMVGFYLFSLKTELKWLVK